MKSSTKHTEIFQIDNQDESIQWRKINTDQSFISEASFEGESILKVDTRALEILAKEAFHDISHFLRASHLQQLESILKDPESSSNDRFVALDLLRNAQIAAEGILPMCQDTGTAIVLAKKGRCVWTDGSDQESLSTGIESTYKSDNLRFSQPRAIHFKIKNSIPLYLCPTHFTIIIQYKNIIRRLGHRRCQFTHF